MSARPPPGCPDPEGVWRQLELHQLVRSRGAEGPPTEVRARLIEAGAGHAKPEVQARWQRGFNPNWSGPEKAREFALGFATSTRDVLTDLGLAKQ